MRLNATVNNIEAAKAVLIIHRETIAIEYNKVQEFQVSGSV